MGKVSLVDNMQIQILRKQRLGVKAIMAAYPDKGWALSTVKKICQRLDRLDGTGSATEHEAGCGDVVGRNLRALKQTLLLSFFNAEKSVGAHVKKSITLSFFNRITFYLIVRCRTIQKITQTHTESFTGINFVSTSRLGLL